MYMNICPRVYAILRACSKYLGVHVYQIPAQCISLAAIYPGLSRTVGATLLVLDSLKPTLLEVAKSLPVWCEILAASIRGGPELLAHHY